MTQPANPHPHPAPVERPPNFVEQIVDADNASGKWGVWGVAEKGRENTPRVQTRFPPEPNGYLHIGHSKSICLNHGLAKKYNGKFNLRFDDTNPSKEDQEYVDSIQADVRWLGADWTGPNGGGLFFASDCFEKMYEFAIDLIKKGKAYVCDQSGDEISKSRGTPSVPATSPFRERPIEESLRLIAEMKEGKHANGSRTVRAKIDLASPNFNMRDPVMYRIVHATHHNTGDKWCIYPMYDWAHGFEDSIEGITHSICTLEFENHRPLYEWFIDAVNEGRAAKIHRPQQIEFARLNLTYTVMSKRFLLKLVQEGKVSGWNDPRMPTISGLRRRGFTPESIVNFCDEVGVTKTESVIDVGRLENSCRDHLNRITARRMAVLRPIKVTITNWADGGGADRVEMLDAVNNPEDAGAGSRQIPFGKSLLIEREDFMETPPKGFYRLAPGVEVRLRYAYWVRCTGVVKDAAGNVTEVLCTYDPTTRGGVDPAPGPDGKVRKVKATMHWVSAEHALTAEVRLFDRLFNAEEPGKRTGEQTDDLNPHSLEVIPGARLEPSLATARFGATVENGSPVGERFQFERLGYFCVDPDSRAGKLVFNRTVTLKDAWAKAAAKG
ncbi:MAG: glutamine--tRNA ligase/YqeY domain fusion protein [Planctomycetota bacterium]